MFLTALGPQKPATTLYKHTNQKVIKKTQKNPALPKKSRTLSNKFKTTSALNC